MTDVVAVWIVGIIRYLAWLDSLPLKVTASPNCDARATSSE